MVWVDEELVAAAFFADGGGCSSSSSLSFSLSFFPKRVLMEALDLILSFTLEAMEAPAFVIELMMFLGFFGGILVRGSMKVMAAIRPLGIGEHTNQQEQKRRKKEINWKSYLGFPSASKSIFRISPDAVKKVIEFSSSP